MSSALARQWDFYDEEEDLVEDGLEEFEPLQTVSEEYEYQDFDQDYDSSEADLDLTLLPVPLENPRNLPKSAALHVQPFSYDPSQISAVPVGQWNWFGAAGEGLAAEAVYAVSFEEVLPRPSVFDTVAEIATRLVQHKLFLWAAIAVVSWLVVTTGMNLLNGSHQTQANIYSFGTVGSVALTNDSNSGKEPPVAVPPGAHSVQGQPSVSAAKIDDILQKYNSPASGKGQAIYDLGLRYGIDPAYAVAFFIHESSAGTQGIAVTTKSIGNIRYTADSGFENYQGFRKYPSWEAGIEDWFKLISGLYVKSWNLRTVEAIVPKYAPSADRNNPPAYINHVNSLVEGWRNGK